MSDDDLAVAARKAIIEGVEAMRLRIEALAARVAKLEGAIQFAHSEGFEWPADPLS